MARLRKIYGRYFSYWYDRTKKTKSKSYPLAVTNKDAAKKLLRRLEDEYAEGKFDPWGSTPRVNGDISYQEAAEAFIESREEKVLRPATIIFDRNFNS